MKDGFVGVYWDGGKANEWMNGCVLSAVLKDFVYQMVFCYKFVAHTKFLPVFVLLFVETTCVVLCIVSNINLTVNVCILL